MLNDTSQLSSDPWLANGRYLSTYHRYDIYIDNDLTPLEWMHLTSVPAFLKLPYSLGLYVGLFPFLAIAFLIML